MPASEPRVESARHESVRRLGSGAVVDADARGVPSRAARRRSLQPARRLPATSSLPVRALQNALQARQRVSARGDVSARPPSRGDVRRASGSRLRARGALRCEPHLRRRPMCGALCGCQRLRSGRHLRARDRATAGLLRLAHGDSGRCPRRWGTRRRRRPSGQRLTARHERHGRERYGHGSGSARRGSGRHGSGRHRSRRCGIRRVLTVVAVGRGRTPDASPCGRRYRSLQAPQ